MANLVVIYTTLTLNSTTLYTYENFELIHQVHNLNCSEIVSQELGIINASRTLVGSMAVSTSVAVTQSSLLLYFMKKSMLNSDGSNDLLTVIAIANVNVNKILVLSVLKKIMDKYITFKREAERNSELQQPDKSRLSAFKPMMNKIIKDEEQRYSTNNHAYKYGAIARDEEADAPIDSDVIGPNQLLLANEEVGEVRQLMLDNINKVMSRGDKITTLVDQTDRLNSSSLMFQRRAQTIKRKMWMQNARFTLMVALVAAGLMYLLFGVECGFPFFDRCINPDGP